MFHAYPYLHMIVVREELRGQGVGSDLLDFLEETVLVNGKNHMKTRVFLTVGDFNPRAEALYQRRGYSKLCEIPNLYRIGVTEKLMMKILAAK